MKKFLKITGIILIVLIATPLVVGQFLRLIATDVPPPGDMIDVGGYKLHIHCVEPESPNPSLPTVIIEAGAGTPSPTYHWLQQGIAETTKVCVYDRAGLAWSEESNLPRDSDAVVRALNSLLTKANIKRPFVFAGHSIAGLYMRYYVEQYPDDVAGMVLLDPSHPEQNKKFGVGDEHLAEQNSMVEQQVSMMKLLINLGVTEVYNPAVASAPDTAKLPEKAQHQMAYVVSLKRYYDTIPKELSDFEPAAKQAAGNTSLGNIPIVVISATEAIPEGVMPDYFPEDFQTIFLNLHKEIVALSTNGRHVQIDTANHMSLVANKEQVAKTLPYIREVILEAATKSE